MSAHFIEKESHHALEILQASSKFRSKFVTLKMTGISDDLLTKLEEFVCYYYSMRKKI